MIVKGIKLQITVHVWLGIVIFCVCKTLVQCNQDTLKMTDLIHWYNSDFHENFIWVRDMIMKDIPKSIRKQDIIRSNNI